MSNEYYNVSGSPSTSATLSSATMRAEFASIAAGFALLPTMGSNGNKAVTVNSGGTALTVTTGTLALGGNFATSGSSPLTLTVTNNTNATFPAGTITLGYQNVPQNSKSANYTTVLGDAGQHILHPSTDANARTFKIDSNNNVAYIVGTAITFINETSQVTTIGINDDTMTLANSTSTGNRSLAQNGIATAVKKGTNSWLISGAGLT